jgi:hypothetical protein
MKNENESPNDGSKESDIQVKVSEAIKKITTSYERQLASFKNQILNLSTEISLKDEALLSLQDEANTKITELQEQLDTARRELAIANEETSKQDSVD